MSDDRLFETDPTVTMEEALQLIRAALDDEGLALGAKAGSADGVTSVIRDGRKFFRVPHSRVLTREADQQARALFAARAERRQA